MVEDTGIEPATSCLQSRRSPNWANPPFLVGLGGLEPPASSLSGMRSNQAELQALLETIRPQQRIFKYSLL